MPGQRRTPYKSVNLTEDARDALQRHTLRAQAEVGKRLSLSAVLIAALALADRHPTEFIEIVTPNGAAE